MITVEENEDALFACNLNSQNATQFEDSDIILSVRRPGELNFSVFDFSEAGSRLVVEFNLLDNITFIYSDVAGDENGTEFRCSLPSQISNTGVLNVVGKKDSMHGSVMIA